MLVEIMDQGLKKRLPGHSVGMEDFNHKTIIAQARKSTSSKLSLLLFDFSTNGLNLLQSSQIIDLTKACFPQNCNSLGRPNAS